MTGKKSTTNRVDLAAIRGRVESEAGQRFWRGLEELAETPGYTSYLHHEFPHDPEKEPGALSRRDALKLMAASAAMAGLTTCTKLPAEKIFPYAAQPPEQFIPGKPLFYATAMPLGGVATGLLVESHMGRPTKTEGNPDHPASLGAADVFAQASVLSLYDPDRSQAVYTRGQLSSWSAFLTAFEPLVANLLKARGAGLGILTETVTSPTLASQLRAILARYPEARWHQYEPVSRDGAREGGRMAFGEYVNAVYHLDRAEVIVSLDSDFLCSGPGHLRYAHDFAARRRMPDEKATQNRLYAIESTPTATGTIADHRLPLRPSRIEDFARAVAAALRIGGVTSGRQLAPEVSGNLCEALVQDLQKHHGASLVIAGDQQPPVVHALAHAMNHALGNTGSTVTYTAPIEAEPVEQMGSLRALAADMASSKVKTLVILGGNPVYDSPADLDFASLLLKIDLRVHLGLHYNETSNLCHWHIPETHYLEAWSDARAFDGTVTIMQPLIAPLYNGRSPHELLAVLLGQPGQTSHAIVKEYWRNQYRGTNFETFWQTSLHDGLVTDTELPAKPVAVLSTFAIPWMGTSKGQSPDSSLEIGFSPDPTVWDGRFSNNGWLQELPKPLTKLTWDNAALASVATAQKLGLQSEDVVKLRFGGREVTAPILILPGHADGAVTLHLGYGRDRAGRVGSAIGVNANALRTSGSPWSGAGLEILKTGQKYPLARTQHHSLISGDNQKPREEESDQAFHRELIRTTTLEEYRQHPDFARDHGEHAELSLYPSHHNDGYAWGMSIDLNNCLGCNACVVACKSENNAPVVGKQEVLAGREMDWIRIDTYFRGGLDNPEAHNQAVMCMQCENAPCEGVCPVGATVHSPEGLNEMIYNRCVGTRYCSNNCPYKVRRFNFRLYADWTTPSLFGLR
ncbi:MAG: TAT-variant-translocated molybdopterin oxidoreductase, partial [Acidobacteria bacterium]|nr:TAT-variant-translocated molybdopterin oxidoreductase [Acidobacteriota bacterium]